MASVLPIGCGGWEGMGTPYIWPLMMIMMMMIMMMMMNYNDNGHGYVSETLITHQATHPELPPHSRHPYTHRPDRSLVGLLAVAVAA